MGRIDPFRGLSHNRRVQTQATEVALSPDWNLVERLLDEASSRPQSSFELMVVAG